MPSPREAESVCTPKSMLVIVTVKFSTYYMLYRDIFRYMCLCNSMAKWFRRKGKREGNIGRGRQRERSSIQRYTCQMAVKTGPWSCQNLDPKIPSRSALWMPGDQTLTSWSPAFLRVLAGSWIINGIAGPKVVLICDAGSAVRGRIHLTALPVYWQSICILPSLVNSNTIGIWKYVGNGTLGEVVRTL